MLTPEQSVHDRIRASAIRNGVDANLALNIACVESHFRTDAKNPASSAEGVYQWLDSSWKYYSTKYWGADNSAEKLNATDNIELSIIVLRDVGTRDWNESKDTGYAGGWSNHPYEKGLCDRYL